MNLSRTEYFVNGGSVAAWRGALLSGVFPVRNLEFLKWLGCVCMLVDHVGVYVTGQTYLTEFAGAAALPLFAVALAVGLSTWNVDHVWLVVGRLLRWGFIAALTASIVRPDLLPINVLFTLCAGVGLHAAIIGSGSVSMIQRTLIALLSMSVGAAAEFSLVGVGLVAGLCSAARGSRIGGAVAVAMLACLYPFNGTDGSMAAVAALPLVALVSLLPRDLPRVRGFFYYVYAGQFPVLWVAASLFAAQ